MSRFIPLVVFIVVIAIGGAMAVVLYRSAETSNKLRIEAMADDAVQRVMNRFRRHLSLLQSTRAFFDATGGEVERQAFRAFVAGLETGGEHDGLQGIGYARMIRAGDEALAEKDIADSYDVRRPVWPQTDQPFRTPITLLEPNDAENRTALGYDMFSDLERRSAMLMAVQERQPRATGPLQLVQETETEKQVGFLVYIPFVAKGLLDDSRDGPPAGGFVYAPFRAGDLHAAALRMGPPLPVALATYDQASPDMPLYVSADYRAERSAKVQEAARAVNFAGRVWIFRVQAASGFTNVLSDATPFIVGAVSLLLAAALAMAMQWQMRALQSARSYQALSQKTLQEKDLMLQEMKHRIKNSFARVLAIARQTAANAESIEAFSESFSARMQAMASAQDVLTRSHWQRTDLKELLVKELQQVFGDNYDFDNVTGPPIELDETATQAFGLTFHELATNALKYGGVAEDGTDLSIGWRYVGQGAERHLRLEWVEARDAPVPEPTRKGFGTRLIDANVIGELGGRIERHYGERGFSIVITVPYAAAGPAGRARKGRRSGA